MKRGRLRFDANLKWFFTELPFLDRFAAAAREGFTAVEYSSPYEYAAAEIRMQLEDHGLKQVLINTRRGLPGTEAAHGSACLPGAEDKFRYDFDQALNYAVALNSEFIHVVAGIVPREVCDDRADAQLVKNLAWAVDYSAGSGVRLLLEAQNRRDVPGYALRSLEHADAIVDAIDDEHLGILFDVYHAQIDGGDLLTRFSRLEHHIRHIQIADPPARHEPGTGEINFTSLFEAIDASRYTGWIGCEYAPSSGDTVAGLSWLRGLA